MRLNKRIVVPLFLAGTVLIHALFLFRSYYQEPYSRAALAQLSVHLTEQQHAISKTRREITALEGELQRWQTDLFHYERQARERLHMGRPDEEIYRI